MLENKLILSNLKEERQAIDETFRMVEELLYGIGIQKLDKSDIEPLISAFISMIRVSGMYNDVMEQVLEEDVQTVDPRSYIKSNIENSNELVRIIHDKYKHLTKWGKQ